MELNYDLFHRFGRGVENYKIEVREGAIGSIKPARQVPLS